MPLFPLSSDNTYTHLACVVRQMVSLGCGGVNVSALSGSAISVRANGCWPSDKPATALRKPSLGGVSALTFSGTLMFRTVEEISQRRQEGSDWHTALGPFHRCSVMSTFGSVSPCIVIQRHWRNPAALMEMLLQQQQLWAQQAAHTGDWLGQIEPRDLPVREPR